MRPALKPGAYRFLSRKWAGTLVVAALGLALTLLAAGVAIAPPVLIRYLDYRAYDILLSKAAFPPPGDVPILVGIDDSSLKSYGQWPWPRYRLAQLIDRLNRAGVRVIALDLLMPESDRTSPEIILRERARDLGGELALARAGAPTLNNDQLLAAALTEAPVLVGYKFIFSPAGDGVGEDLSPMRNTIVRQIEGADAGWPTPTGVLTSLPVLTNAAVGSGFTNADADEDGTLRRVPLLIKGPHGVHPSLALATLLHATTEQNIQLDIRPGEASIQWQGRSVPLDGHGNLLLAFRGPRKSYRYLSAGEVLAGKLADGSLRGKVAIVGAWASGLGDRHVTPVDKSFPGMEVHALVIDNLLSGAFLQEPPWTRGAELFFLLALGLMTTWLLSRYGFLVHLLLLVGGTGLIVGGAYALFAAAGIYLSPVMPLLLLFVSSGLLSLAKYGIEVRKVFVRTRELAVAQDATILGMTFLAESRDKETGEHILRTQRYVEALARRLRHLDKYRTELTETNIELLFKSAPLHDIGKVGIPDAILHKPGKLTDEEFDIMKRHPAIGSAALAKTLKLLRKPVELGYLDYACQVAISHHEKWDGTGYPQGLEGDHIPLAGRLMALADVYDALISERVYKSSYPHEQAKEMILAGSGVHFDPEVVEAFLACEEDFQRIATQYSDQQAFANDQP